jgi:tetratricopeptide (TPR) repeat protein
MFSATFAPLLLAGAIGYPSPLRFEESHPWTGRTVIMKKTGTRFFRTDRDGSTADLGVLTRTDYVVVRERDDRIWVKQDGVEGWIPKDVVALPDEGVEHFSKMIKDNPNDAGQLARRSKAYELKGDLDAALRDYDQAIRIAPAVSSWWNNRGNLFQKLKEYDKALENYNRAIELRGNSAIVHGNRGNAFNHKREYDHAIADFDEALRLNPRYVNAFANRANSYRELKQFDKALADYDAALKIDPRFAYALTNRGSLRATCKEYDKAMADFNAAAAIDPRAALCFYNRGKVRRTLKEFNLAIDDLDHAIWLDKRYTAAFVERGNLRRELKQYDRALKDFDAAMEIDPKASGPANAKAWLLSTCPDEKFRDGNKAVELAARAVEQSKRRNTTYLQTLAAAHAEAGAFDEAVKQQKLALEQKELSDEDRVKAQRLLQKFEEKKPWREE